jgi:hypothetical protein
VLCCEKRPLSQNRVVFDTHQFMSHNLERPA